MDTSVVSRAAGVFEPELVTDLVNEHRHQRDHGSRFGSPGLGSERPIETKSVQLDVGLGDAVAGRFAVHRGHSRGESRERSRWTTLLIVTPAPLAKDEEVSSVAGSLSPRLCRQRWRWLPPSASQLLIALASKRVTPT